jgi:flagellar hook-basal body complex protein FliE
MAIDGPSNLSGALPVRPASPALPGSPADGAQRAAAPGASFAEILRNSITEVNELQAQADAAIRDLTLGRTDNVTAVVNQVEKADLAFRALLAVRNKLIDAYDEINRLRV